MAKSLKTIIEAFLFAAERPLTPREIQAWLPEEKISNIAQALTELQAEYEELERSFTLKRVAEGYQFRSRKEYAPYLLTMMKASPTRLSRAAMETLAIIAYKQPILRQEVERLRGVDCGGILKTLLEKDLIRIMGRKSLPGRPLIYGTTRKFLEVFDLRDLSSLPKLKEIEDLGGDEAQTEPLTQETVRPDTAGAQEDESTENPDENGSGAGTPGSPRSA